MSKQTSPLIRCLALASFVPPALAVVYAAVTGHQVLALAGLVFLLASGGLLVAVDRRTRPSGPI